MTGERLTLTEHCACGAEITVDLVRNDYGSYVGRDLLTEWRHAHSRACEAGDRQWGPERREREEADAAREAEKAKRREYSRRYNARRKAEAGDR